MPVVSVPEGATPGVLDNSTLLSLESICDVGSLANVSKRSVSARVQVCIVPVGSVSVDAWGRYFHLCVEFVQPPESIGKRRLEVPNWSTTERPEALRIECDPAGYWIGTWAKFWGTGGVAGDKYLVTMTFATMQQQSDARLSAGDPPFYQVDVSEPAFRFALTAQSMADVLAPNVVLPGPAIHHSGIRLVHGSLTWGGMPVTSIGQTLPLNAPVTTGTSTIYKTGGET